MRRLSVFAVLVVAVAVSGVIFFGTGNVLAATWPSADSGDIIIKKVLGFPGEANNEFKFTLDLPGSSYSFYLKDGHHICICGVDVGTYTITETNPAPDYVLTKVICEDQGGSTWSWKPGTLAVIVTLVPVDTITCTFYNIWANSVGDTVYSDTNGNGAQDPVERGIPNVYVCLYGTDNGEPDTKVSRQDQLCDGTEVGCMFTNADGMYRFEGLDPNRSYCLQANTPEGYYLSGGENPRNIPPLEPGEDWDEGDFGFRSKSLIPTLTHWGMMAAAAILGLIGFLRVRRRRNG